MQFSLNRTKKRSFIKSRHFLNIILITFVLVLLIGSIFATDIDGIDIFDIAFGLFFILCFFIALAIFLPKHKAFGDFIIDEEGIKVNNEIYPWNKLKHYHWLGEAQNERVGASGIRGIGYDPVNPNKYADTQVVRIRVRKSWWRRHYLNLEVDKEKINDLVNLLEQRGVKHMPNWRHMVGV